MHDRCESMPSNTDSALWSCTQRHTPKHSPVKQYVRVYGTDSLFGNLRSVVEAGLRQEEIDRERFNTTPFCSNLMPVTATIIALQQHRSVLFWAEKYSHTSGW